MKSKFQEAFEAFKPIGDEASIKAEIKKIVDQYSAKLNTREVINFLHSTIDLTSLSSEDNEDQIYHFTQQVNKLDDECPSIKPVASICVYPNFVKNVREALTVEGVHVCAVSGGFPSSQTFPEVKVAETLLAIQDGADEIDIVLHVGKFLAGNYEAVCDEIEELREATKGKILKVILETGALQTPENIQRASILALFSGADFIKTSTGKGYPGASLEAAYVMAQVLKEYHEKYNALRGLKVSGGVRTTEEAIQYLSLVQAILGDQWMTNELFRIGASSLEKDILKSLQ